MSPERPEQNSDCRNARATLEAFVDGELDEQKACAVRDHLRGCASCFAEILALTELSQSMRDLGEERAPGALWKRISDELDRYPHQHGRALSPAVSSRTWLLVTAIVACVAIVSVVAWSLMLPRSSSVVTASVQDFITYRARGWNVDFPSRDVRSLSAWAQARVFFAVPEPKQRLGAFEVSGIRLCWLLNRRLLSLTYSLGSDHAVVYVMESDGLALPAADRTLTSGARASVHQYKGHGVAVWTESDLVFVLVAAEKVFERVLDVVVSRAGNDATLSEAEAQHRRQTSHASVPARRS